MDTRAIDAEIDRVLSVDAPPPWTAAPTQKSSSAVVRVPGRGEISFLRRFASHTGGLLWNRRSMAREPRGGQAKIRSRPPVAANAPRLRAPGPATERVSLASVSHVAGAPAGGAPVAAVARQNEARGSGWFQSRACFERYGRHVAFDFFGWHPSLLGRSRGQSDKDHRRQRIRRVTGWQRSRLGSAIEWHTARPTRRTRSSSEYGRHTDKFQFVSTPNESE